MGVGGGRRAAHRAGDAGEARREPAGLLRARQPGQRAHGGATDRTGGAKHEHAEGLTGSHQVKMPLPGSAGNAETPDVCCGVSFRTREQP